jgi:hypothetical protein
VSAVLSAVRARLKSILDVGSSPDLGRQGSRFDLDPAAELPPSVSHAEPERFVERVDEQTPMIRQPELRYTIADDDANLLLSLFVLSPTSRERARRSQRSQPASVPSPMLLPHPQPKERPRPARRAASESAVSSVRQMLRPTGFEPTSRREIPDLLPEANLPAPRNAAVVLDEIVDVVVNFAVPVHAEQDAVRGNVRPSHAERPDVMLIAGNRRPMLVHGAARYERSP